MFGLFNFIAAKLISSLWADCNINWYLWHFITIHSSVLRKHLKMLFIYSFWDSKKEVRFSVVPLLCFAFLLSLNFLFYAKVWLGGKKNLSYSTHILGPIFNHSGSFCFLFPLTSELSTLQKSNSGPAQLLLSLHFLHPAVGRCPMYPEFRIFNFCWAPNTVNNAERSSSASCLSHAISLKTPAQHSASHSAFSTENRCLPKCPHFFFSFLPIHCGLNTH